MNEREERRRRWFEAFDTYLGKSGVRNLLGPWFVQWFKHTAFDAGELAIESAAALLKAWEHAKNEINHFGVFATREEGLKAHPN